MYSSKRDDFTPLVERPERRDRKSRRVRLVLAIGATLLILLGWKSSFPVVRRQVQDWFRVAGPEPGHWRGLEFDWASVSFLVFS